MADEVKLGDVVPDVEETVVPEVVEETEETEEVQQVQETSEETEDSEETDEKKPDLKDAITRNEELKRKLKAFEDLDGNVYEDNERLEQELREKERLAELAAKNADLEAKIQLIERRSVIESLIKNGQLTTDLKDWANELTHEQLMKFAKNAPKRKTILDETNSHSENKDEEMDAWVQEQMRPRILK